MAGHSRWTALVLLGFYCSVALAGHATSTLSTSTTLFPPSLQEENIVPSQAPEEEDTGSQKLLFVAIGGGCLLILFVVVLTTLSSKRTPMEWQEQDGTWIDDGEVEAEVNISDRPQEEQDAIIREAFQRLSMPSDDHTAIEMPNNSSTDDVEEVDITNMVLLALPSSQPPNYSEPPTYSDAFYSPPPPPPSRSSRYSGLSEVGNYSPTSTC